MNKKRFYNTQLEIVMWCLRYVKTMSKVQFQHQYFYDNFSLPPLFSPVAGL